MRAIEKRPPPKALSEWRTPRLVQKPPAGMECTYEEMRKDTRARNAVEEGLFREQGGICAYTGTRIELETDARTGEVGFHIEHLIPQMHCEHGQDTAYGNLVACWPRANHDSEPSYGARKKGSWPSPAETHLFISPLDANCSGRFRFDNHGEISAATPGDQAAETTIQKLGLADSSLTALRANAIRGALYTKSGRIKLKEAQKLLRAIEADAARLDGGGSVRLRAFCFAIEQALIQEIRKLEGIMAQRKAHTRP